MTPTTRVAFPLLGWPNTSMQQRPRVSFAAVTLENREDPQRMSDHSCVADLSAATTGKRRLVIVRELGREGGGPPRIGVPLRKYWMANQNTTSAFSSLGRKLRAEGKTKTEKWGELPRKCWKPRKNGRTVPLSVNACCIRGGICKGATPPPPGYADSAILGGHVDARLMFMMIQAGWRIGARGQGSLRLYVYFKSRKGSRYPFTSAGRCVSDLVGWLVHSFLHRVVVGTGALVAVRTLRINALGIPSARLPNR